MKGSQIKILQVIGNARLGGVAACILNYFKHTDRKKFRFDFVVCSESGFDDEIKGIDPSAEIYHITPFQKNCLKASFQLEKICRKGYDIVHSHLTTLSAFSLWAAKKAGVPVRICHAHSSFDKNSDHYIAKSILRPFAVKNATHLMACSTHAARSVFRKRAGEAFILRNAIEAERFYSSKSDYATARKKLGLSEKVVLFTGRFAYQKNLPFLIHAFAKAAISDDMTLVLVGDGEERGSIIETAKKLNISQKLRLIPACDPSDWYKAADLFCMPSRYEGLGMSAIEAQASGLKCLLSRAVPKETDITGKCVFLNEDADEWAAAIKAPSEHCYNTRESIRASGYDICEAAPSLAKFYEQAAGRP